jgi:hypothetical protein
MAVGRNSRGRIRPHERDADDDNNIIGANIAIVEEHQQGVAETIDHQRRVRTTNNYRNRVKHINEFMAISYPEYCTCGGVRDLSDEELSHHHKNTKDLVYTGLNVSIILAFLAAKKNKADGMLQSFTNMRKYHDAILYGAEQANQQLPRDYYVQMDKWMASYRKEAAKAKAEGRLEEQEADPVSFSLFRLWMQWAIDAKNPFVWVFGLLQWNFMARSISVGTLAFHNFRLGEDNIIGKYDKHKADQGGGESPRQAYIWKSI